MERLNGTRHLGLCLGADKDGKLHLNVYADAAHNVHVDARSHGGIAMQIGRGTTLAESSRIKGVPISSTESELIMAAKGMSFGIRELEFSKYQQIVEMEDNATLHEDNTSTIHLIRNGKSNSKMTRHINLRYFFIKHYLETNEFEIVHCPTSEQIADILTKPLQGSQFLYLRDLLLGYKMP